MRSEKRMRAGMRTVGGHAAPQQPCSSCSHCASASSAVDLSRLGALQQHQTITMTANELLTKVLRDPKFLGGQEQAARRRPLRFVHSCCASADFCGWRLPPGCLAVATRAPCWMACMCMGGARLMRAAKGVIGVPEEMGVGSLVTKVGPWTKQMLQYAARPAPLGLTALP